MLAKRPSQDAHENIETKSKPSYTNVYPTGILRELKWDSSSLPGSPFYQQKGGGSPKLFVLCIHRMGDPHFKLSQDV